MVKNVVALGALQAATQIMEEESYLTALRISLKAKCAMVPMNEEAFRQGKKAAQEVISAAS